MKKLISIAAMCAAMVGMVTGCFTSAKAYTKTHPDGNGLIPASRVKAIRIDGMKYEVTE